MPLLFPPPVSVAAGTGLLPPRRPTRPGASRVLLPRPEGRRVLKAPRANPYNINDILTNRSLAFGFPSRSTEWYLVVPQVPQLLTFTCLPHSEPPPITFSLAPGWQTPPALPLPLWLSSAFSSTAFRKAGLLSRHQATTSLSCSCLSIPHSSFLSLPTSCPGYQCPGLLSPFFPESQESALEESRGSQQLSPNPRLSQKRHQAQG